jgi:hypothetical protein
MGRLDGFLGGSAREAAFLRQRPALLRGDASLPVQLESGASDDARRDEAAVSIVPALRASQFAEKLAAPALDVQALALK